MNRLSIILAFAFVSYSLGAPENISESQGGLQNYGLKNGSDLGLEKQDGVGDGNVNEDTSTSDPSEVVIYAGKKPKPKPKPNPNMVNNKDPNSQKRVYVQHALCTGTCAVACVLGAETSTCMACMSKCLQPNNINRYNS